MSRADTLSALLVDCADTDKTREEDQRVILPALSARSSGWRVEVQKRGRYWQWRKGRADNREARYGGKFELLGNERKAQYEQNKAKIANRNHGTTGAGDSRERDQLLPVGGTESRNRES